MRRSTETARVATGLSAAPAAEDAAVEAVRQAGEALDGAQPDLAFLFMSPQHLREAEIAAALVRDELRPGALLGCVADGVLAGRRELEDGPGLAVWAGLLPGARLETFHLVATAGGDGHTVTGFPELDEQPALVALIVDPFTFPAGHFLRSLNDEYPGLPLVGGIAAGAGAPGMQVLFADDELLDHGAVGVVVSGVPVRTIVSQGCAPIGRDAVVTRAEGNVVFELAGQPALERLKAELAALASEPLRLAAGGLLAGIVIDENRAEYERGDYLIRALLGADESTGAIMIGDEVRIGQTLRFHVRDGASADDDLREALERGLGGASATGALLFTCNGRGTHMFSEPNHDAVAVAEALGSPALAGFFCGGEIGPVGGRAFLHGFTATMAIFLAEEP